jgi:hypothetical protein
MAEAIQKKGVLLGVPKGIWRVIRCNPFCAGGYDPVERDPKNPPLPWESRLDYEARLAAVKNIDFEGDIETAIQNKSTDKDTAE